MQNITSIHSLSDSQVRQFDEQGVIGPFTLLEREEALSLWNHRIRKELLYRQNCVFQDSKLNYDRHLDIKSVQEIVCSPQIVEKLKSIMGPDILCWRTEWFPKYPGDAGTVWHQARRFYEFEGQPKLRAPDEVVDSGRYWVITVWIAMVDATIENGCMKFLPGSHKEEWYFDESRDSQFIEQNGSKEAAKGGGFFGYDWEDLKVNKNWSPDESKALSMEVKAGQFFMFTSKCVHGSYPNISKTDSRFAMAARYVIPEIFVYENMESFKGLGEVLSLDKYSTLLVAGEDKFKRNKVAKPWL